MTKITELNTIPVVDRTTDLIEIVDASDLSQSFKVTPNSLLGFTGGNPVSTTDTQTLTNKTLTSPTINTPTLTVLDSSLTIQDNSDPTKQAKFEASSITAGQTRTYTLPDASTTLVGTGTTQTLTGKTLTAPTITNPTLTVDTVSEFTSANGVTIDGLNIKDSALNTNNSVPNNAWNNTGAFGSSWAWTSYTPVFANTTLGNGTVSGRYNQVGKTVNFWARFVLGGTSAMGTTPTVTLPVTASSNYTVGEQLIGDCQFGDSGTADFVGPLRFLTTTTALLTVVGVGGTYASLLGISATVPMTWVSGDDLTVTGRYEVA